MSIKSRIDLYRNCYKRVIADLKQLSLGQKSDYDLLQLAHRLEKGLLIQNPKPMWGWEKAEKMVMLLKNNNDTFSTTTAKAVLSAYLAAKSKSQYQEDRDKCADFLNKTGFQPISFDKIGGSISVEKTNFSQEELSTIEKLFNTRHSCREFSDKHVSKEDISEAVNLALRCPSACNRQPFRVYAIEPSKLEQKLGHKLQYSGDRTLVITGDVRAFQSSEMFDWIVSPAIFAGYLTLSLHSLCIGSCVVRKDLLVDADYNKAIRAITGMSESERIILELFIGYYKDEYISPASNRNDANGIIKYV